MVSRSIVHKAASNSPCTRAGGSAATGVENIVALANANVRLDLLGRIVRISSTKGLDFLETGVRLFRMPVHRWNLLVMSDHSIRMAPTQPCGSQNTIDEKRKSWKRCCKHTFRLGRSVRRRRARSRIRRRCRSRNLREKRSRPPPPARSLDRRTYLHARAREGAARCQLLTPRLTLSTLNKSAFS
jgi:hypothetical protein